MKLKPSLSPKLKFNYNKIKKIMSGINVPTPVTLTPGSSPKLRSHARTPRTTFTARRLSQKSGDPLALPEDGGSSTEEPYKTPRRFDSDSGTLTPTDSPKPTRPESSNKDRSSSIASQHLPQLQSKFERPGIDPTDEELEPPFPYESRSQDPAVTNDSLPAV